MLLRNFRYFRYRFQRRLRGSVRIETSGFYCLKTSPVLHEGLSQETFQTAIDDLQIALINRGFLKQKTSVFDAATKIAVEKFQEQNRLRVDGIVGALTWAAIKYPVLVWTKTPSPETQEAVRELQETLRRDRFDITVDGVYGWETVQAVKRFQRRYGLCPDGECGPMTWSVLLGQRPEWDGKSSWQQLWLKVLTVSEQLAMIAAVQIGIHFSPLSEQNTLPFLHTFVTAYGLTCVSSPFLETFSANFLEITRFPLLRFSPYVLVGFLYRQVLAWVLSGVPNVTS